MWWCHFWFFSRINIACQSNEYSPPFPPHTPPTKQQWGTETVSGKAPAQVGDLSALNQIVSYSIALNSDHSLSPECSYFTWAHGRDNPDMPTTPTPHINQWENNLLAIPELRQTKLILHCFTEVYQKIRSASQSSSSPCFSWAAWLTLLLWSLLEDCWHASHATCLSSQAAHIILQFPRCLWPLLTWEPGYK